MAKRSFSVRALWDEDAKVFYSKSDIIGLHIEAKTIDEFEAVLLEVGPDLIVANHISKPDLMNSSLGELIPAIIWERPESSRELA